MTFAYWIGSYAVIFLIMFADFYKKAYKKPAANGKADTNGAITNGVKKAN